VLDRDEARANAVAAEVNGKPWVGDVGDEKGLDDCACAIEDAVGPVNVATTKLPNKRLRRAKVVARNKLRPPKKAAAKKKTFYSRYPTFVTVIKKKSTAKK
jgi:hypothetical protein